MTPFRTQTDPRDNEMRDILRDAEYDEYDDEDEEDEEHDHLDADD